MTQKNSFEHEIQKQNATLSEQFQNQISQS